MGGLLLSNVRFSSDDISGSTEDLKSKLCTWWEAEARPVLKFEGQDQGRYKVTCEKKLGPHITIRFELLQSTM